MKIQTTVEFVDVEVNVTLEDIVAAIHEATDAKSTVLSGINNCFRFLKAIPDSIIAELTQKQRETIHKALSEQIQRLAPPEVR